MYDLTLIVMFIFLIENTHMQKAPILCLNMNNLAAESQRLLSQTYTNGPWTENHEATGFVNSETEVPICLSNSVEIGQIMLRIINCSYISTRTILHGKKHDVQLHATKYAISTS